MAEVKWIKITTDMFDNRKIKHLRKLPDGNNIVLIWVMLLTMAGRCNTNGMIFLTENIPYTSKMLADELDFEENTVQLALNALEQLNMIVTDGDFFSIAGWEEYQSVDRLSEIREYNRLAKQKEREKKKLLQNNVNDKSMTSQRCQDTDIDKEEDKERDKDNILLYGAKTRKRFSPPTLQDVQAYCIERNNNVDAEKFVNHYTSNGWMVGKNKMKDWKAAVRTWEKSIYDTKTNQPNQVQQGTGNIFLDMYINETGESYNG